MNLQELGTRIRERRENRGLKQLDVANALQVSAQAVSKWERGENAPDISLLLRLAAILGVTTDWLLAEMPREKDVFAATVLVSSVLGYSRKSQELPLPELAIWANSLLFMLTETILKHDGIPVKQLGDGLLCFFSGSDHQARSIEAARKAVKLANEPLKIALASGQIYLGNIGHPDYSQLDVLGAPVNTAFCLLGWMGGMTRAGIFMPNSMSPSCPQKEWLTETEKAELTAIGRTVEVVEIR
jgi:transcriptional regulator with XRE-family HTH domain